MDKCKYCGEPNEHTHDHITKPDECFSCWHWRGNYELDLKEPDKFAIIDGHHYRIGDEDASKYLRGFGGSKFVIHFFDGRNCVTTNFWHQGTINSYWRQSMPDNATFIPYRQWVEKVGITYLSEQDDQQAGAESQHNRASK